MNNDLDIVITSSPSGNASDIFAPHTDTTINFSENDGVFSLSAQPGNGSLLVVISSF